MAAETARARQREPCALCGSVTSGPFVRWPGGICLRCATATTTGCIWRSAESPPRFVLRRSSNVGRPEQARLVACMLVKGEYLVMDSRPCWHAAWRELALALMHTVQEDHQWTEPKRSSGEHSSA